MLAYINDLTAYLIIKEVCNTVNIFNNAERRAETERDQSSDAKGIFQMLLSALPDIAAIIKDAQQPDTPPTHRGVAKVSMFPLGEDIIRKIVLDFLANHLSPEQFKDVHTWLNGEKAPDPEVPSDSPSLNDGSTTDGDPDINTQIEE